MAHTFILWCTIEGELTCRDDEVEDDPEGFAGDVMPREALLVALEQKIRTAVSPHLRIVALEVEVDQEVGSDELEGE
jgi:hypothetical protein